MARKGFMSRANTGKSSSFSSGSHGFRVFADADALKERARANIVEGRPGNDPYHSSGLCAYIVRSHVFASISIVMVCLNSLWIGIELDISDAQVITESPPAFQAIGHGFCAFFVLELLARFCAARERRMLWRAAWFVFDAGIAALVVCETWVLPAVVSLSAAKVGRGVFRVRLLLVLRALRLARVVRELPELLVIVRGICIALRAILVVLALLGFIVYFGAIVFRVLLEGTDVGSAHFDSVRSGMGTLLLEATLSGSRGVPIVRLAYRDHVIYAALILIFVLLANVTVMGVLSGLLVQTVRTVAEVEKEENAVRSMSHTMEELWQLLVTGDDESITFGQLKKLLEEESTAEMLKRIDVDLQGLVKVSGFIFEQNFGSLSEPQFKRMLLDLRNKNAAKVKDHVETRKFINAQFKSASLGKTMTAFLS